jgi:hypothetical protein
MLQKRVKILTNHIINQKLILIAKINAKQQQKSTALLFFEPSYVLSCILFCTRMWFRKSSFSARASSSAHVPVAPSSAVVAAVNFKPLRHSFIISDRNRFDFGSIPRSSDAALVISLT